MLLERKARSCSYDAARRTARLEVGDGGGAVAGASGAVLLDRDGRVVGVDLEPGSSARVVVMLGPHEAVASTRPARLEVSRDSRGEVAAVVIHGVDPPGGR